MKIIAEYNNQNGMLVDSAGTEWYVGLNINFEPFAGSTTEPNVSNSNNVGLTAEDLIKLKDKGII
ncbi:MAG: hypothetical protein GY707_05255 [Desulfobacteraceae bacterium]|nr:hypothetical protein [Desulfobacteraceae bacterium]